MSWLARTRLVLGHTTPDKPLVDAVMLAASTRPLPKRGAPVLSVPAACNVWICENRSKRGRYDIKLCDPTCLATLGILVHPNMITDHSPPRYEHALGSYHP